MRLHYELSNAEDAALIKKHYAMLQKSGIEVFLAEGATRQSGVNQAPRFNQLWFDSDVDESDLSRVLMRIPEGELDGRIMDSE